METINIWEEALYGFFTHFGFSFIRKYCILEDEDGSVINLGKIIPSQESNLELSLFAEKHNVPMSSIPREFEKEVVSRLRLFTNEVERFQYLSGIKYRFAEIVAKIPDYRLLIQNCISILTTEGKNVQTDGMYFNILYYWQLLSEVDTIIDKAFNISKRVLVETAESKTTKDVTKLKWLCSDSIAGYIISELISKRYIEEPVTNGHGSYSRTAKVCWELFEFKAEELDYIKDVINPERNRLSDFKRKKLTLPDSDQVK